MNGALHLHASIGLLMKGGVLHVPCRHDVSTSTHGMLSSMDCIGLHAYTASSWKRSPRATFKVCEQASQR